MLVEGKVGALFRGKSEFGPRALGNRSIIADPSKHNALAKINKFIKAREDFRPLAPITTRELAQSHFNILSDDLLLHHMLTLVDVPLKVRHLIRSAVHIDGSARLQVISQEESHFVHALISTFYARTGVPALINTSFNQRGEPIVNTLEDALCCFSSANLDFLVVEDSVLFRESQDHFLLHMHNNHAGFPLD